MAIRRYWSLTSPQTGRKNNIVEVFLNLPYINIMDKTSVVRLLD